MVATPSRGKAPKAEQTLLEDMFDPETVERMKEALADDVFQAVDMIAPEYRCPRCAYGWRGNPLPPSGVAIDEGSDGET